MNCVNCTVCSMCSSCCVCTVKSLLLVCVSLFVVCLCGTEKVSASIDFLRLSLFPSLIVLHCLCCLLVRELGCLGVCQAPTVVTLHLCLCIWAPVTLATAFLFLKQLSESLRVSLRVCVFSSLCPNYETPETQPPWGFLPANWCPVCMVYFGRVENWRSLFFPQSKIRLPLCQHTLAFLSLYAAKAHNS